MNPLLSHLRQLQFQLRWRLIVRGLGLCLTGFALCAIVLGGMDWLVQSNFAMWRWGLSLLCALGGGLLLWHHVVWPCRRPLDLLEIAFQLERQHPECRGQLAAQVAAGSESLPAWEGELPRLRWAGWPLIWPVGLACGLMALIGGMVLRNPGGAQLILARLSLPHERVRWPRSTDLQLFDVQGNVLSPQRTMPVDARQPLTLYVRDREPPAPAAIRWEIKAADGRIERFDVPRLSDGNRNYDFQWTWLPARGRSWVRITGGDDVLRDWCPLESLLPPAILDTRGVITFPDYLGLPPQVLENLPARLTIPVGSHLRIEVETDQPVAEVRRRDSGSHRVTPIPVNPGAMTFIWEETLQVTQRELFWFEVFNAQGLTVGRPPRHELIVVADTLPEAQIRSPAEDLFVTPHAVIPLQFSVHDDHALRQAEIRLHRLTETASLQQWNWTVGEMQLLEEALSLNLAVSSTAEMNVLQPPFVVRPGDELVLDVTAEDFAPGSDRQIASLPRVLRVISIEEKTQDIRDRWLAQVDHLTDHVERLRHAFPSADAMSDLKVFTPKVDRLQSVLEDQQRVLSEPDGCLAVCSQLQVEADWNNIPSLSIQQPLQIFCQRLGQLRDHELAAAQQALTQVDGRPDPGAGHDWGTLELVPLRFACEALVSAWDEILEDVDGWRSRTDIQDELQASLEHLRALHEATLPLTQQFLARAPESLSAEERQTLQRLSQGFDQLATELNQTLAGSVVAQPAVRAVVDSLIERGTVSLIREAGRRVAVNNLGQALELQSQGLKELEAGLQLLVEPNPVDIKAQLDQFKRIQEELIVIQSRLQFLLAEIGSIESSAQESPDLPQLEQSILDTRDLASQLRLTPLPEAEELVRSALQQLQASQKDLQSSQPTEATASLTKSLLHFSEAAQSLQRKLDHLTGVRQSEQRQEVTTRLLEWSDTQGELADQTQRLRQQLDSTGRWGRSELRLLMQVAGQQTSLSAELEEFQVTLDSLPVLQTLLSRTIVEMQDCSAQLKQRVVADAMEQRQRLLQSQLKNWCLRLQEAPAEARGSEPDQVTDNTAPLSTAELHLLTDWQRDVAQRAEQLLSSSSLTSEELDQKRERLAIEQGQIAQLLQRLLISTMD